MSGKTFLFACRERIRTNNFICRALSGRPVLEMFTKENCSLCDDAKEKLKPYEHLFILREVDITLAENKLWFDKYKYDIPVFHLDGQYLMRHKVHQGLLGKKLDEFYGRKLE